MAIGAGQQHTDQLTQRHGVVVAALNLVAVPMTPQSLAKVIQAWKGEAVDARSVTTLCRRDRKRWHADTADEQDTWLVPALNYENGDPVHALITVSTWPLSSRIVTPHSPRSDHAGLVLALIERGNREAHRGDETGPRLWTLAGRFATGIPGAVTYNGLSSRRDALRRAAAAEYEHFATTAAEERAAAAQLMCDRDVTDLIWGRSPATDTDS